MDFKEQFQYKEDGQGAPVLLLHGWGGNENSFSELFSFLSQKYYVLSLALPMNLSKPWTLQDYVTFVISFLKHKKIKKPHIVCHSFGGRVSVELAQKHAQKIVFIDSAGIKPRFSLKKKLKVWQYKLLKILVKWKWISAQKLQSFGSSDYKQLTSPMKKTFINIVNYNQVKLLKGIENPTLILWGKQDKDTPLYMAKIFHKRIKNSKLIVEDGGHFAYLKYGRKWAMLIDNFLS